MKYLWLVYNISKIFFKILNGKKDTKLSANKREKFGGLPWWSSD